MNRQEMDSRGEDMEVYEQGNDNMNKYTDLGGHSNHLSTNSSIAGPLVAKNKTRSDPKVREGEDHFKKIFTYIQRKVEYENFRFKHPTLLAVCIESINSRITDRQRMFTRLFFRYHVSQDLSIADLQETIKFKINSKIDTNLDKISKKDKIVCFNENISIAQTGILRDLYIQKREEDGWLYLDFIVEGEY
jgi:hypothetical protein